MRLIELKLKNGKPLHCPVNAITCWYESVESSNYCTAYIGGKELTLGQTAAEVTSIVEDASAPPARAYEPANPKYGRNK